MSDDQNELVRLSKIMSERGLCSRREADDLIAKGQVFVDGLRVTELGVKYNRQVKIELGAKALAISKVTVILNKPVGYVSSQPESGYQPAIVLLTEVNYAGDGRPRVIPQQMTGLAVCGRLDIDSQGLLIFSQDGVIAKKIIGENSGMEKEYLVRVTGPMGEPGQQYLPAKKLELLREGLELDGAKLKRAQADWINPDQLKIVLVEGKKRQIRRMCEMVGLKVAGLKRVRVGRLMLGKLPEGQWRFLNEGEEI